MLKSKPCICILCALNPAGFEFQLQTWSIVVSNTFLLGALHCCINLCCSSYWGANGVNLSAAWEPRYFSQLVVRGEKRVAPGNNVTKWQSFYNVMAENQASPARHTHQPTATKRTKILENMSPMRILITKFEKYVTERWLPKQIKPLYALFQNCARYLSVLMIDDWGKRKYFQMPFPKCNCICQQ